MSDPQFLAMLCFAAGAAFLLGCAVSGLHMLCARRRVSRAGFNLRYDNRSKP